MQRSTARLLIAVGNHHTERALQVGSPHLGAALLQGVKRVGMGMPVPVLEACTDDTDERVDRVEERWHGGTRTVMGNQQELGM